MTDNAKYPDTARGRIRAYLDARPKGVNQRPEDECIGLTIATAATPLRVVDVEELLAENVRLERAVSWPDVQPQDERDTIGDSASARVREFVDAWSYDQGADAVVQGGNADIPYLRLDDITAVLDNREAWRNLALSRGAKQDERDGDVRAVAQVLTAFDVMTSQPTHAGLVRRIERLRARFADRIAALDARDAKGGEPQ